MFDDLGKFILRVSLGVMMLLHGISKVQNYEGTMSWLMGSGENAGLLAQLGLPVFLAYGVFVGELVAPALLILGILPRLSSLAIMATMVVATLSHPASEGGSALFSLGGFGGWAYELQGLYFFAAFTLFLLGSGRLSLWGKW